MRTGDALRTSSDPRPSVLHLFLSGFETDLLCPLWGRKGRAVTYSTRDSRHGEAYHVDQFLPVLVVEAYHEAHIWIETLNTNFFCVILVPSPPPTPPPPPSVQTRMTSHA